MKRVLVILVAVLALAGAAVAVVVVVSSGEAPRAEFTEEDAEAAVSRALDRCKHNLRDAREVSCTEVMNGFACRADGRYVAGFEEPNPERPQFEVMC